MTLDVGTDFLPAKVWKRGGQRPVLALHCSLAHCGAWAGLAALLTGVTITAVDLPGHGRRAAWDGRSDLMAESRNVAMAMAEKMAVGGPIDLLGHSFGGVLALWLALERPELVRSLTLIEPVLFAAAKGDASFSGFAEDHHRIAALVAEGKPREASEVFHAQWGGAAAFADMLERTRAHIVARIQLVVAQNPMLIDDSVGLLRPGGLESLAMPVLLVRGAQSPPVIGAVQRSLMARIAQATQVTIEGAGHMVPISHAVDVASKVQAHLDRS